MTSLPPASQVALPPRHSVALPYACASPFVLRCNGAGHCRCDPSVLQTGRVMVLRWLDASLTHCPAEGLRQDGRRAGELRRLRCRLGVLGDADGSALLDSGATKVLAAVYGPREVPQRGDAQHDRCVIRVDFTFVRRPGCVSAAPRRRLSHPPRAFPRLRSPRARRVAVRGATVAPRSGLSR